MKLTVILMRTPNRFKFSDPDKILFKNTKPIKLCDKVSEKPAKKGAPECVQEMFNMMTCLKENEFIEAECSKEITLFKTCNQKLSQRIKIIKANEIAGTMEPGSKKFSGRQLNTLLSKFPPQ